MPKILRFFIQEHVQQMRELLLSEGLDDFLAH
jgi:hypothetical protein